MEDTNSGRHVRPDDGQDWCNIFCESVRSRTSSECVCLRPYNIRRTLYVLYNVQCTVYNNNMWYINYVPRKFNQFANQCSHENSEKKGIGLSRVTFTSLVSGDIYCLGCLEKELGVWCAEAVGRVAQKLSWNRV